MRKRLAVVTTHPIQYHSPWFRALEQSGELELQVYYGHKASGEDQAAAGFGVKFEWDTPLLEGYHGTFLPNLSRKPSVTSFFGIDVPEIGPIVERERFDAVIVNGWHYKGAWQAIRACWRNSVPVMVRSDSHLRTPRSRAKSTLKWFPYRRFIPKFDACLAVGRWSREYFLHYGACQERVFILPHVIDVDRFEAESRRLDERRDSLRAALKLETDAFVFVFAGKFIQKKRPMDFVRAIEQAAQRDNRIGGLMVGDGTLKESCQSYVEKENVPVKFTGFLNQTEIPRAYVAGDALVLPSDGRETWGLVVNEAMACGRPCLVSDQVGCGPDMIQKEETGAVFPVGDVRALADLMVWLSSSQRVSIMREAARRMASRYTTKCAVDATLRAFRSVC